VKGTIQFALGKYQRLEPIGIPICNEFHEQYQEEGEQFPSPLEYTDEQSPPIYLFVMNKLSILISISVK
jgi:hypothetical protein